MINASCHCGAIQIEIRRKPRTLTDCNCSICRRYGALWAYYQAGDIRVRGGRGARASYVWGERNIRFVRCRACGCITHWEATNPAFERVGVNARNFPPEVLKGIRVQRFDGAAA